MISCLICFHISEQLINIRNYKSRKEIVRRNTQEMDKEVLFIKPFIIYSQEVRQSFPLLAYYLKFYSLKKGNTVYQKYSNSGEDTSYLKELMDEWQSDINQIKSQIGMQLSNPQENKKSITDYTLKIFARCDHDDRNDNYTKQTQQDFTLVSRYLEMLAVFGPLDQDLNQKRIYAKAKAVEIKKKLDNPQMYPRNNAGSQGGNNNPNATMNTQNVNINNNNISQNQNFVRQSVFNHLPPIINANNITQLAHNFNDLGLGENTPGSNPQKNQPVKLQNNYNPRPNFIQFANPYVNESIGFNISQQEAMNQIQDLCKKSISELDFNQFQNAKEALKLALIVISNVKQ